MSFSDEGRGELIAALTDAVLTADGLLEACQRLTNALEWEPKPSTQQLEAARSTLAGWRKEIDKVEAAACEHHYPAARETTVTTIDPAVAGELLWTLQNSGHPAEARVRAIPGVGLELRFTIDGELRYSHRFTAWDSVERTAQEKRGDFEARGWEAIRP